MKSEHPGSDEVRSQGALSASAPLAFALPIGEPNPAGELSESSWINSVPIRSRLVHMPGDAHHSMRLTERDCRIVELVFRTQALRADQVQVALFTPGGASRCQRRLTLLVRHRYLDRLPRETVNEPAVYVLSRRSVEGNRLVRERFGEEEYRKQRGRLGSPQHLLAINDIRVRVVRACRDLGWSLSRWERSEELATLLRKTHLVPDAYFQIQREVDGREKTSAFFLELERTGGRRALRAKLQRYADLYYGGRYAQLFGTRALRVLFVFALAISERGATAHRVDAALREAGRLGVTIARFAGLDQLVSVPPAATLTEPFWRQPSAPEAVALFDHSAGSEL